MSKELDYIADLEKENRTLKSLLFCTKRSCNNCGKVTCENFQRQRIDCCGLWVSYKDYVTELESKIADIKANCDLAIEGRDIKIKELEKENAELKEKVNILDNCDRLGDVITEAYKDQLTKAKEIIRTFLNMPMPNNEEVFADVGAILTKAEQFIKEIEK